MEALKAERAKRKALAAESARPAKYMRRGDLEKLKDAAAKQAATPPANSSESVVMRFSIYMPSFHQSDLLFPQVDPPSDHFKSSRN